MQKVPLSVWVAEFSLVAVNLVPSAYADGETNQEALAFDQPSGFSLGEPRANTFRQRFLVELAYDDTLDNRLGPLSHFEMSRQERSRSYGYVDWLVHRGRDAAFDTLLNSFRESAVNSISFESAIEAVVGDNWAGRLIDRFVEDSVGNTHEQELSLVSASPTLANLDDAWWSPDGMNFRFGVRPWYLYTRFDMGHQSGGSPIAHADVRLHLDMPSFGSSDAYMRVLRLEGQLVFPLPKRTQIVLGGSMYPGEWINQSEFDTVNHGPSGSIRLEHQIGKRYTRAPGIVSIGASAGPHETIVFAQISFPFDAVMRN